MYFSKELLPPGEARILPIRILAHLGDAVFALYERERETLVAVDVSQMHEKTALRTSAAAQAVCLERISNLLSPDELDLIRRAKNVKTTRKGPAGKAYRQATAFETLVGFLYLTSPERLKFLLDKTTAAAT